MIELLEFTGPKGYLLLFIGGSASLAAIGAVVLATLTRSFRPALILAGVALGLGVGSFVLSLINRTNDIKHLYKAVVYVASVDRVAIVAAGTLEAQANLTLGALVSVPVVLLSLAAIGAAFGRTGASR